VNFRVLIERPALKALSKIPLDHRDRIIDAIRGLGEDPRPAGAKKLSGRDAWRIRLGSYRVIYEINADELVILVVAVGHRKDVYR
jgi:mRNA interferase RelE/StbE